MLVAVTARGTFRARLLPEPAFSKAIVPWTSSVSSGVRSVLHVDPTPVHGESPIYRLTVLLELILKEMSPFGDRDRAAIRDALRAAYEDVRALPIEASRGRLSFEVTPAGAIWLSWTAGMQSHRLGYCRVCGVFFIVDRPGRVLGRCKECSRRSAFPEGMLGLWRRARHRKLVRIYARGELAKTHEKQPPGSRSTDHNDYPKELTPYTMRDPQRMIRQATDLGPQIGRFMEALLSGELPWTKIRQAQMLLRLADRFGTHRVDAACRRALAFELLNVRRVESIVRQDLDQLDLLSGPEDDSRIIPIQSRFLRAPDSFTHHQPKGD